jgi:hypothetical protein
MKSPYGQIASAAFRFSAETPPKSDTGKTAVFLDGATARHTRSLCAQSPAQSEQWRCWFARRRSIFGSAEIAANSCLTAMLLDGQTSAQNACRRFRQHEAGAAFPQRRSSTRIVSVARIRLDSRKSVRSFKGIICGDISEFESYMASHAVRSPPARI